MRKSQTLFALLATGLGLVGGCGPLSTPEDPGRPIWTIRGSITNADGVSVEGDLRVALMWYDDCEWDSFIIAQDVSVTPSFPSSFSIELREPPPAEALMDLEVCGPEPTVSGSWGMAYVIVYDDRNGDGQFTFTGAEDREFVDRVLAISDGDAGEYQVWYVATEEPLAFEDDAVFAPGLHILGEESEDSTSPDDVLIVVEIDDDPSLDFLGCDPDAGWQYYGGGVPPVAPLEDLPPEVRNYRCMGGGDLVEWVESCPGVDEILPCTLIDYSCTVYQTSVPHGEEPPPDWPCEVWL